MGSKKDNKKIDIELIKKLQQLKEKNDTEYKKIEKETLKKSRK